MALGAEQGADARAADDLALDLAAARRLASRQPCSKPIRRRTSCEPLRARPSAKSWPTHNSASGQRAWIRARNSCGSRRASSGVKWQTHTSWMPASRSSFTFSRVGVRRQLGVVGAQDIARVGVEGHRAALAGRGSRALDDLADEVLMATMKTVEVADGDDGGQGRDHGASMPEYARGSAPGGWRDMKLVR